MTQNIGTVAIKPIKPLILASKSEARDKILQKSGILYSIKPSNINESEIKKLIKEYLNLCLKGRNLWCTTILENNLLLNLFLINL